MRAFVAVLIAVLTVVLLAPAIARADGAPLADEWVTYRDRFIEADGRVVDTANKGVSHTEGQGWAMLFAESFDDRATFDRVWDWTRDKLRRPADGLFSWRWDPSAQKPIADTNNATDGDTLIAWALARAAWRWHNAAYAQDAHRIVVAIREKLIAPVGGGLVLLPGIDGFTRQDGSVLVNPSYYVYPALRVFPRLDPSPKWARLRSDGLRLLAKAHFGDWGLPADWVTMDKGGNVAPAANVPPRFGYDAIRIPLYLIWGYEATDRNLTDEMRFWDGFADKPIPAWVNVTDGAVSPFAAPNGFQAVIDLVRARLHDKPATPPQIDDKDDYYSASLILLAGLAGRATGY